MSISNTEKRSEHSLHPLWELIPKTCIGLVASVAVPLLVLFILVAALFGLTAIFSEPKVANESSPVSIVLGIAFFISFYAAVAAVPCAGVFGIPAILIGWRLRLIRWWTCVIVGFFLSSVPGGLFLFSAKSNSTSSANGIQFWIHGVPTIAGMIEYLISVMIMGLMGALGGFSFWLVWRFFSRYGASELSTR
jgi:hypothetical protein